MRGPRHLLAFTRSAPAIVAAALLLALPAAMNGCGKPGHDAAGATTAEAHTTAMSPGNHLDPPALAGPDVTPAATGTRGVPVLCYHYFRGRFAPGYAARVLGSVLFGLPALGPREFWTTPAVEFERHLRWLQANGRRVLTLDEVADLVAAGAPLPANAVVLTIDDADRSVYEHAFPLLRKYGVKAHLFVPTAHVGRSWSGLKVCTEAQLKEMADSGLVLLESHTHDLHYKVEADGARSPVFLHPERIAAPRRHEAAALGAVPAPLAAVADDLLSSREAIDRLGGRPARWLAWPYGFASPQLDGVARGLGFRGTVSLSPHDFRGDNLALRVGRYTLTAHTTMAQVQAMTPPAAP
jgi:peptidoglycan/xylan/chitin deacetylase (PgdA/CDA1 family)